MIASFFVAKLSKYLFKKPFKKIFVYINLLVFVDGFERSNGYNLKKD